jgi:hypothetical protein
MTAGAKPLTSFSPERARRGLRALGVGLVLAAFVSVAAAQQPPSAPPAGAPAPVQVQPAPPEPPAATSPRILPTPSETISAIGRFIDQSIANVNAGVKGAGDTLGGVPGAAGDLARGVGDAAGTIARLPGTNVVKGWERCAVAPNGAPDCEVASVALCKSKGFERGKSLDITSAHKCPAQVWLEGRQPAVGECKDESFVSRALCQ